MFIHVFPWIYREINNILVSFKKFYLMKNGISMYIYQKPISLCVKYDIVYKIKLSLSGQNLSNKCSWT